jgi:hypothetical protein
MQSLRHLHITVIVYCYRLVESDDITKNPSKEKLKNSKIQINKTITHPLRSNHSRFQTSPLHLLPLPLLLLLLRTTQNPLPRRQNITLHPLQRGRIKSTPSRQQTPQRFG